MGINFAAMGLEVVNSDTGPISTVGLVRVRDGEVVATELLLVTPSDSVDGPGSDADDWSEALPKIAEFIQEDFLVVHDAALADQINAEAEAAGVVLPEVTFFSTFDLATSAIPKLEDHSLPTLAKVLKLSEVEEHDSEFDALASAMVCVRLAEFAGVNDLTTLMRGYKVKASTIGGVHEFEFPTELPTLDWSSESAPAEPDADDDYAAEEEPLVSAEDASEGYADELPDHVDDEVEFPDDPEHVDEPVTEDVAEPATDDEDDNWDDGFEAKQVKYVDAPSEPVDDWFAPESESASDVEPEVSEVEPAAEAVDAFPEGFVPQTRKERRELERQIAAKRSRESLWGESAVAAASVPEVAATTSFESVSEAPVARERTTERPAARERVVEHEYVEEESPEQPAVAVPPVEDEDDEPNPVEEEILRYEAAERARKLAETRATPVVESRDEYEADDVDDEREADNHIDRDSDDDDSAEDESEEDEDEDEKPAGKANWYDDPDLKVFLLPIFPAFVCVGLIIAGMMDLAIGFGIGFVISIPMVAGIYFWNKKRKAADSFDEDDESDEDDDDEHDDDKPEKGRRVLEREEEVSPRGRRARQAIKDAEVVPQTLEISDRERQHAA